MKTFMGYMCPGAKSFNPSWLMHWRKIIIITKGLPTAFLNFLSLLYLSFSRAPFPKPPQMWRSMATAQWLQSTKNGSISWEHIGSSQDRFYFGKYHTQYRTKNITIPEELMLLNPPHCSFKEKTNRHLGSCSQSEYFSPYIQHYQGRHSKKKNHPTRT